ncbi:TPA: hypothetical protein N0F65_008022 [Lagenidium giganteum]|uniref:Protein MON2 homolog n=1 Tax=Lagenidium giganteum TaxID=4803 RepID=A0AAV2YM30_9STRA|nr:TPA: hypothetical protein N0F65_008022 [Lagenidium giganteum]
MDFLRLLSDDLNALRNETKKKYPVVKEAVDKALEMLPVLQKQYAQLIRVESAPGPGHPLFKCESVLRPFLLACNHTNASHKIIILALVSIQRLVSWDAIEQSSVGSILRVLQIQAEKNTHTDVQVKLLQTLLQLVTLSYEEKTTPASSASDAANPNAADSAQQQSLSSFVGSETGGADANGAADDSASEQSITASGSATCELDNALVGNEDLVMQAIWICLHLHGGSSGASSVVGNTAAMTIRQVVSLAFGKVQKSPEAKHVGVLVFQELCFLSREESGVWLKRTATSPMSVALGVELLETILQGHCKLFRSDPEFQGILKQHICSLIQSALETACSDKHPPGSGSGSMGSSSNSSSNSSSGLGGFFPLLVRVMRLAGTFLCNFCDALEDECTSIVKSLLEIVSTGAYIQGASVKSPSHAKVTAQEAKMLLQHSGSSANAINLSGGSTTSVNFVTWPVLLALEVLNRVCVETAMTNAMTTYTDSLLVSIAKTISSVVTTSPPIDFKPQGNESLVVPRSGLEFLNEQDSPALQSFFGAIRVAITCQSNLLSSIFDLSRITQDPSTNERLAKECVSALAAYVIHALNCTMRHCREVELITMSLKSYHVLATTASRLRANMENQRDMEASSTKMDEVVAACLRALCAFSFPLPDGIKGSSRGPAANANSSANDHADDVGGDEGESSVVVISWREVHAMKALFGAAHIMDEELAQTEWGILLEGFEIVVGLTDTKVKSGQYKLPTKNYRISAFRLEDEDVEQQLVMLGNSIMEFFRDALKLSSSALRKLSAAVRKVCWDLLGLPHRDASSKNLELQSKSILDPSSPAAAITTNLITELPSLPHSHQMKIYQNYLGVGLNGTGTFVPFFSLRMLLQLASCSKRCFEEVMEELVVMSTFQPPPTAATHFPQLNQFQIFTADNILLLMQSALQNVINGMSPTGRASTRLVVQEQPREPSPRAPHVFDQEELFKPLVKLMRSDMKDRMLFGLLDLLNTCGHLIHTGWPLVLSAVQEAAEIGDAKSQVTAFKCLRLIVDDLLVAIPKKYLGNCVRCIGRFACCAKDVNISLTAVNELWSVADIVGKQKARTDVTFGDDTEAAVADQWGCAFGELSQVALDDRTEVRNCAINTLFGTAVTYGAQFDLREWQLFLDETVLPMATKLYQGRALGSEPKTPGLVMHHSRDSASKQWDESRVLLLTGISRVLQTNSHYLLAHPAWFGQIWRQLLHHVALNAEGGMSKEVVLASVNTLQTLLQVSSACDIDQIAQSQPVRAGAGMRVVGGALVAAGAGTAGATAVAKRVSVAGPVNRDPMLWKEAFDQLLQLCRKQGADQRSAGSPTLKEDDEQEIAAQVVLVLVTLYTQSKDHEFKDDANVERLLDLFDVLIVRHVLVRSHDTKSVANITTNSLQSRVLNAYEECGSFAAHPRVHTKMLDQMVKYVNESAPHEMVFFTRHALMALAKLYASVTPEARAARFLEVLACVQPFLKMDSQLQQQQAAGANLTATQKAAAQQWKHALRVLLVLISQGLAAVRLDNRCWRPLLDTITSFLAPSTGTMPPYVQTEEDEELVLSVLECLVDSVIAMLGNGVVNSEGERQHYRAFCEQLMALLCSGVDAREHHKVFVKCCVRQLATLGIQREDADLSKLAHTKLVHCCSGALLEFADVEAKSIASAEASSSSLAVARERVIILLGSAAEVGMTPQSVLEMFPALCTNITSMDLEVRKLIQRLLVGARLPEFCGGIQSQQVSAHVQTHASAPQALKRDSGIMEV